MARPLLIGLVGRAGVGKDTAAAHMEDAHGFHTWAFAEPLRSMLIALLDECGHDHTWCTEPALKNQAIPGLGVSYRELAQTLGTEWARSHFGPDFWLRATEMALGLQSGGAPVAERIVISDVRFPNEASWVTAHGGVLVRIQRPGTEPVRGHESESHIDLIEPWAEVWNTSGLGHLQGQLDDLVQRLQLTAGATP